MKKLIILTLSLLLVVFAKSQDNNTNLHIGYFGEGVVISLLLEQDLLDKENIEINLRGGFSLLTLDLGYGLPHGLSVCLGGRKQFEFGVSGVFSSTEEFWGSRVAKEYHVSPVIGYRTYVKSEKAFFRFYLNPMINTAKYPLSYGYFNGKRQVFMLGISVGFKLN